MMARMGRLDHTHNNIHSLVVDIVTKFTTASIP